MGVTTKAYDVFLSHNSREKPQVEHLARRLKQAGLEPWLDTWCIVKGRPWQDELALGIHSSSAFAFFFGPSDMGDWARQELYVAMDRAAHDPYYPVFPVLLPGLPEPFDFNALPPFLRSRTAVDFRTGIDDPRTIQYLINAIKGLPPGPDEVVEPTEMVCPYQGLDVFDERHTEFFFGREADIQRLIEKLKGSRFLAVLGPSGSGKSSVVRAGLIPALRRGALPGSHTWSVRAFTPTAKPLTALAAQLVQLSSSRGMHQTVDRLAADERTMHFAEWQALADHPASERVVWVVDQFEEVFTLCRDEHDRTLFLSNLIYAASAPGGRGVVVLTLRADFYPRCAAYPEFCQQISAQQYLVGSMDREKLRQVIEEPAWHVALEFERGLVDTILADVAGQPGALPLLEFALLELWKRRRGKLLTLEGYRESGGVHGAIGKKAEDIYAGFSREEQEIAKRILLRLTQPGEGTEDTRRRAAMDELVTTGPDGQAVEEVVTKLVQERLLTTSGAEPVADRWVDVSHEALIRGWPKLRQWVEQDREGLREHRRLTEAAQEWHDRERDEGYLYRGASLARASEWSRHNDGLLNELERLFLQAGLALQEKEVREEKARQRRELEAAEALARSERRRARIFRTFTAGLTVLLLMTAVIAYLALQARANADREKRVAESRQVADSAFNQLAADPELSALLAAKAVVIEDTPPAEVALRQSLLESRVLGALRGHSASVNRATFSPDGNHIVTASDDKTARVWDWRRQRSLVTLRGHSAGVTSAAFSADGRFVVTASVDKTARVWDWRAGQSLITLRGQGAGVNSAMFSPDGRYIATAGEDNTARVWDWHRGRSLIVLRGHAQSVNSAAFSPSGKYLVTASDDDTARVWEWRRGRMVSTLRGHTDVVFGAAFSPDGKYVATASKDGTARVWDWRRGRTLTTFHGHTDLVFSAAFSHDGKYVLTASNDRTAQLWDWHTGRSLVTLRGHAAGVFSAAFSSDAARIVTASEDKTARVWQPPSVLSGHTDGVTQVEFSRDSRYVVTASRDKTARVWDVHSGRSLITLRGHTDSVFGAAFSPDVKYVVTASADKTARVWEWSKGHSLTELRGYSDSVNSAAFSPDGKYVVTANGDGTAWIWNWREGRILAALRGHTDTVIRAAFSADGRYIVTASNDGTARVWDWRTRRSLDTLQGHMGTVFSAAFSPDGKYVVTASSDKIARVWNWRRAQRLSSLRGHTSVVFGAAFNSDGRYVITASGDRSAQVWDWRSEESLVPLRGHTNLLIDAAFSPDGRYAATASEDGTARIYPCDVLAPVDDLLKLVHTRVTRGLTPEERRTYLP